MKKVSPVYWVLLLVAMVFTLATKFVPLAADWNQESDDQNALERMVGEGRKLFANESFTMADVYYHSGYYPSIFDKQEKEKDVAAPAHGKGKEEDSTADDFLGKPLDWIAALERHFIPNKHTHLSSGGATGHAKPMSVQEILPWIKLAADLNPKMIETYDVGAYWLRTEMHKPKLARNFILDGLRHNPGNTELLFDLGQVYYEGYHETNRAYHVWLAGLKRWGSSSPDTKTNIAAKRLYGRITMSLALLEENQGHWQQAVKYLEKVKAVSPNPRAIEDQIAEIRRKAAASR